MPISWSAVMDVIRRYVKKPVYSPTTTARRWMCCGFASRAATATAPTCSGRAGSLPVLPDRGDYWQCAYVIPKGGIDRVKANGIEAFRNRVVALSPFLADRIGELKSFDDVRLLSVMVNRLRQWWRLGLICIG